MALGDLLALLVDLPGQLVDQLLVRVGGGCVVEVLLEALGVPDRGLVGEGTVFGNKEGLKIAQIRDGTSNTIAVVEANDDKAVSISVYIADRAS